MTQPCTGITPTNPGPNKTYVTKDSTILHSELFVGITTGCSLDSFVIQYSNTPGIWIDAPNSGDAVRDGLTFDPSDGGGVSFDQSTYKWPGGEKIRVKSNSGTAVSAEFEAQKCPEITPNLSPPAKINFHGSHTLLQSELYFGFTTGCMDSCNLQYKPAGGAWTAHPTGTTDPLR